jgi:hypothetical protein
LKIQIEFTGYARHLLDKKTLDLQYEVSPTYKQIICELGNSFPELIGLLISQEGDTLMSGNLIILNGNMMTAALDMEGLPQDGDRLILMSLITGG